MTAPDTSKPPRPYRLWVAVPAGEYEDAVDLGEVATRAEADVALAALAGPWLEATLRRPDRTHDEGARPKWRRLPASKWRRVRHWTAAERERFASDDVDRIAAWLRRAGVRLTWERALRSPWPGHERGPLTAATCLPPDETLRSMRRRGCDALRAVRSGLHGRERREQVVRTAVGEARMCAHTGKQGRVGLTHHHRHGGTRRQPDDEHAAWVGVLIAHHLAHDAGNQGGLAGFVPGVGRVEPVPAARHVGVGRLLGLADRPHGDVGHPVPRFGWSAGVAP